MFRRVLFLTFVPVILLSFAGAAQAETCGLLAPCPPPPSSPPPPPPPPPPEQPPPPAPLPTPNPEQRLLELMNRERAEAGLSPLSWRDDVAAITEDHSGRMAREGRIWHNDEYFSAETRRRLGAKTVGENVALNKSVDDAHRRLMESPGHRANILNPRFAEVGVGVVRDSDGDHFITEGFVEPNAGRPRASSPAPAPAPTSTPAAAPARTPKAAPAPRVSAARPAPAPAPAAQEETAVEAPAAGSEEPQVLSRTVEPEAETEVAAPSGHSDRASTRAVSPVTAAAALVMLTAAAAALIRSARTRRAPASVSAASTRAA